MTLFKVELEPKIQFTTACVALLSLVWAPIALMAIAVSADVKTPLMMCLTILALLITRVAYNCCVSAWAQYGNECTKVVVDVVKVTAALMVVAGSLAYCATWDYLLPSFCLFVIGLFGAALLLMSVAWVFDNIEPSESINSQ